jgi:ADP-ribosyl-[dinitrogen reductase] hydrolase
MMFVSGLKNEVQISAENATTDVLKRRAIGAYLGLAVGDALGGTVEFMTPREIQAEYREHRDMIGGGWLRLRKGQITDDTEMSLALGASIIEAEGQIVATQIAEAFSQWMRRKPIDIGHTVRRGLAHYRQTGETCVNENDYDAGNGACMRCLPIALATLGANADAVHQANCIQAHITHHNELSDIGTLYVIRMTQTALLGGGKEELKQLANELVEAEKRFAYTKKRTENPSAFIVDTLRAVLQALFATDSFESALIDVVNRGGDADTTGAILGMITGAYYGLEAIPARWLRHLDAKISSQCIEQAQQLLKYSPLYKC